MIQDLNDPAQFGTSVSADFSKDHWTFKMDGPYKVFAGRFAIIPMDEYRELRKVFDEHQHNMYVSQFTKPNP